MKTLFDRVFKELDECIVQNLKQKSNDIGTCCCVALVRQDQNKKKCFVANLGDTRAVLNKNGKAKRISKDHKATEESEVQRVKQSGGIISNDRVDGCLAVTRALGDISLKKKGIICEPDVTLFEITDQTPYLIIASDGLWDVVDDQKAIDLLKEKKFKDAFEMSKYLVQYAIQNGSEDNTSVLVLKFQK